MAFETFADFIAMGKHGPFVWAAYGITLIIIVANIIAPLRRKKALMQQIQRKIQREKLES